MEQSTWIPIGKIVAPQGLRGEVRVYPLSEFPERFEQPGQRWLLRPQALEPEAIQLVQGWFLPKKRLYVVQLEGIHDRAQAESLINCQLLVPVHDRPPLAEGEFHYLDLMGLTVIDQAQQQIIGIVTDLINAGNDLLEVELLTPQDPEGNPVSSPADKPRRVLIPFVEAIVPVVDLEARRIEITPPLGLLDL